MVAGAAHHTLPRLTALVHATRATAPTAIRRIGVEVESVVDDAIAVVVDVVTGFTGWRAGDFVGTAAKVRVRPLNVGRDIRDRFASQDIGPRHRRMCRIGTAGKNTHRPIRNNQGIGRVIRQV